MSRLETDDDGFEFRVPEPDEHLVTSAQYNKFFTSYMPVLVRRRVRWEKVFGKDAERVRKTPKECASDVF